MAVAKGTFHSLHQNIQEVGNGDEYMISQVYFDISLKGQIHTGKVTIKQTTGSKLIDDDLEVYPVEGFEWDGIYTYFQEAVRKYYRGLIGYQGSGISFSEGAKVSMGNNIFDVTTPFEIDV